LSSRSFGSKCIQVNVVANRVKEAWTSFYSPQKESAHWDIKDPDMSVQETGYVREMLLEPGFGTGQVRCWDLTQVKAERLDMSSLGTEFAW
jgi:hypothetical protein